MEQFKIAINSMEGYPKMVGFMGGEPLLHPLFKEFCEYASLKIPKEQLGLWTCLPEGYEHYRELICSTFGNLFVNDHSRDDIYHAPILVGVEEVFPIEREMFYALEHCWIQEAWSASINPRGAFFCEIAASMSILFDGPKGWPIEQGWWWRVTKDFREQIEYYCPKCGASLPLDRRSSNEGVDDISPRNLERLKKVSKKIQAGKYIVSDLKLVNKPEEMAAYKDLSWRNKVAKRYGIYLHLNEKRFLTPILLKERQYAA